jgi:spore germination protein KB
MLEKGRIGGDQAVMLMVNVILPTALLSIPAITVKFAKQDAWISIVLATSVGFLIARIVANLGLRFPGKTLFEYAEEILGRIPGKIVGLLYIWWFLHMNAEVIREFGIFLVATIMPETPIVVFQIFVVLVAAYAARNGLEVLSRFNQLFVLILGILAIVFVLPIKDMKLTRLLPVFDTGLLQVLKGAAMPASWLGEIVTFAIILPYVNLTKPNDARRIADVSILLTGFLLSASVLETLLVFGPYMTSAMIYPIFNVVREISIANFLERLDYVIFITWVLGGFIKVGVFYFAAVLGSAQCFKLKDYRPLVAPVGVILVALSILLHEGIVDQLDFVARTWPPYALIVFEMGIPLVLLFVTLVRGKGGKNI